MNQREAVWLLEAPEQEVLSHAGLHALFMSISLLDPGWNLSTQ